ncbi:MAG: iron transporter [Nocardioidaceae bacterium]
MKVRGVPSQRTIGHLKVDVAVGPIARMFEAATWLLPENAGGGAVFAGRAGEVRENVPAEPADAPPGLFNLDAHVYDAETGHPVPYLDVHIDVARDGTPVLSDLALVPVARPHKGTAGLHYGNNVALDPTGSYQVEVRIAAGALTGTETTERLGFVLDFDDARTQPAAP